MSLLLLTISATGALIMPESYIVKQFLGGFYAFFLLFLSRAIDSTKIKRDSYYRMFTAGMILGVIVEAVGYLFGLWYYPLVLSYTWAALLIPVFYGMFMMIITHSFQIAARYTKLFPVAFFIVTTLVFVLLEGINLFSKSWLYTGWFSEWTVMYAAWFPLVLSFEMTAKFIAKRGSSLAWSRIWPSGG